MPPIRAISCLEPLVLLARQLERALAVAVLARLADVTVGLLARRGGVGALPLLVARVASSITDSAARRL